MEVFIQGILNKVRNLILDEFKVEMDVFLLEVFSLVKKMDLVLRLLLKDEFMTRIGD
jgi:hypothetical protein